MALNKRQRQERRNETPAQKGVRRRRAAAAQRKAMGRDAARIDYLVGTGWTQSPQDPTIWRRSGIQGTPLRTPLYKREPVTTDFVRTLAQAVKLQRKLDTILVPVAAEESQE